VNSFGGLSKAAPWPHRLLSFALAPFHSLGGGKFPIPVWLGAPGTRMQFTSFMDRCATSRTRHGEYLFQREFLAFHHQIIKQRSS
jgi:hypothetical protein